MGQGFEMDTIPDRLLISTSIEELRQQKVRLWVKSLILSILLGIFCICTAVLAVLYATKTYASSPASTGVLSTALSTVTVTESSFAGTATETTTKTHVRTTTATTVTTTTEESMTTTTSISTKTLSFIMSDQPASDQPTSSERTSREPAPGQSQPTRVCEPDRYTGPELMILDANYYFGLMNSTLRKLPSVGAGRARGDKDIYDVSMKSIWRCGRNGQLLFLAYCQGGITTDDVCMDSLPVVPPNA